MMMWLLWLRRLAASPWKTAGAATGVALAMALLGTLGAFLTYSFSVMTQRAIDGVPVDWQVQLARGASSSTAVNAIAAVARPSALERVQYADVLGFSAALRGTVQTTGAGVVVGLDRTYRSRFPLMMRTLTGSSDGVVIAQQTAANLHARVGDRVSVVRDGLPPLTVRVDGVVDLPYADSFFQAVGVPSSAAPPAPPDNVLMVPSALWHRWFDAVSARHPSTVRRQLHVRITHALPDDPVAALDSVMTMARGVELRAAGEATVGDNLAAQLQSTREDAFYARLLFLFLGLPGAVLAAMVAVAVIRSGGDRRRREGALLRIRGASGADIRRLTIVEAVVVALLGCAGGVAITYGSAWWFLSQSHTESGVPFVWALVVCGASSIAVFGAYLWGSASMGVAAQERKTYDGGREPFWRRIYLDWVLLVVAATAFWKIAAAGYQVVVAPEGVLQATVSYDAFLAPLCLWLGGALLAWRLFESALANGGSVMERMLKPMAGTLAPAVAATLSRQRSTIAFALVMVGLAVSFAVSTAVFDATYNAQARVDAQLTNGADVTVTLPSAAQVGGLAERIRGVSGVAAVATVQHRFAYVGQDLQDLFGIDALSIDRATQMSDAYFAGGDARAALAALDARADGVLVSQETVNDFQLNPGDRLNLRLQTARDGRFHSIPFTFVGVVREFPTAPRDSFIVANAKYVSAATGAAGAQALLVRVADGADPSLVGDAVRPLVTDLPGARVSDIAQAVRSVGSSLTSVDLRGLSRVELVYAVVLAAGVAILTLALGFAERRRNHAILVALGARGRQLSVFLWSEGVIMLLGGIAFGIVLGFGVASMLVKVLTGVFDPPPTSLTIPWFYLLVLLAATVSATVGTIVISAAAARRDPVRELRR